MNTRCGKFGSIAICGLMAAAGEILGTSPASAVPITYTEADTANGTLDGVPVATPPSVISNEMTDIIGASSIFTNAETTTLSTKDVAMGTFIDSATVVVAESTDWVVD